MKISFYEGVPTDELSSGRISHINWESLLPHLKTAFNTNELIEKLVGIEIKKDGIKATFKTGKELTKAFTLKTTVAP